MKSKDPHLPLQNRWTHPRLWLMFIVVLAFGLRFWQLGEMPPGFYRDEAYNGLDALTVLEGRFPLYFPANNGREPLFIYLAAGGIALFGRTAFAVRAAAALAGSLTTVLIFGLARRWYGTRTGLLAAFLWAATVWSIHLSRVGLRVILLVPVLTGAAWLATNAAQAIQDNNEGRGRWLWLAAGVVYALAFYTYLAGRFTPVVVAGGVAYFLLINRNHWPAVKTAVVWGGLGAVLGLTPLLLAAIGTPEILLGRPGQVSIFNAEINKGDFWGTLWQHWWRAVGLFVWRGDDIIRHNPPGRPLFDLVMAAPFLVGLVVMGRRWREPVMALPLLWVGVMLWPTILAEDAPHFLRAAGILPAVLLIPAVGLSEIASWPKLARLNRRILIGILLSGSLALTVRDYFFKYNQLPDTGYLFEAAAVALVEDVHRHDPSAEIWIDRRYRDGWPSVSFLLDPQRRIFWIDPPQGVWPPLERAAPEALYVWPFDQAGPELAVEAAAEPAWVEIKVGSLARGDLEPQPYPLYIGYEINSPSETSCLPLASFGRPDQPWRLDLVDAGVEQFSKQKIAVRLFWSTCVDSPIDMPLTVFVHVVDRSSSQLIGQIDAPPAGGQWPLQQLSPGLAAGGDQVVTLSTAFDSDHHQIFIGVYPSGEPESPLAMTGQEGNSYSENTVQLNRLSDDP